MYNNRYKYKFYISKLNMTTEQKTYIAWDKELASKAAKQHKYIFVSEGQKQRKTKLLSGAENAWNPRGNKPLLDYIYLSELRIMGLKNDVVEALSEKLSDSEIKTHLKSAYTSSNHGQDFLDELEKLKEYRSTETTQQKSKIKYGLEDLGWFIDAMKDVREEPIDKIQKSSKISPKSKRDFFRDLYQRAVDSNKYVNVSNIDTTGAKLKDQPAKKGNFVHSELTRLETDNIKSYKRAIEWAFGSAENHEEDIEAIRVALGEKKGKKVTRKATPKKETVTTENENVSETKSKKKQMGSPRKGIPGSKSPGAVVTKGSDNFTPIPSVRSK
jgi:hypothetical protein